MRTRGYVHHMSFTIDSTVTLSNGVEMPRFGLGTYKSPEGGEVEGATAAALEVGYRSIDTASLYGNERAIGRVIAASDVPRNDIFVTTKVWNEEQGYEETLAALHHSLERLELDYVDLYLMHWPIPRLMESTWRAMEELLAQGHTRAIGVCNFLVPHLEQLDTIAESPPVVNQFEFHPWLQQPEVVGACAARGIAVEAWAPLARGRVFDMPEIGAIGERHGKSAAQVTLRWLLQRGVIAIPKSVHPERVRENAAIFDFELSAKEIAAIDALDRGERIGRNPAWAATGEPL